MRTIDGDGVLLMMRERKQDGGFTWGVTISLTGIWSAGVKARDLRDPVLVWHICAERLLYEQ